MKGVWVGVDVGGTKVLAGVVDADGTVSDVARAATPGRRVDVALIEDALVSAVHRAAGDRTILGVGVAAAGFVDSAAERVMFAPHLPWLGDPVRSRLSERLQVPVTLENDASAAAVAEQRLGAARGADSMVLVTMGTGIGGGLVIGGRLVRGAHGMAGEYGHMQVVPDGEPCECGGRGCWEQYSSGNALVRYARARMESEPHSLGSRCNGRPELLTGPMITEAADEGDLLARAAFASVGGWLGIGLANLVAAIDPECVVVGGGVSEAGERLLEPARLALGRSLVGVGHREIPPIHAARFGARAGLVGAALLARDTTAATST